MSSLELGICDVMSPVQPESLGLEPELNRSAQGSVHLMSLDRHGCCLARNKRRLYCTIFGDQTESVQAIGHQ